MRAPNQGIGRFGPADFDLSDVTANKGFRGVRKLFERRQESVSMGRPRETVCRCPTMSLRGTPRRAGIPWPPRFCRKKDRSPGNPVGKYRIQSENAMFRFFPDDHPRFRWPRRRSLPPKKRQPKSPKEFRLPRRAFSAPPHDGAEAGGGRTADDFRCRSTDRIRGDAAAASPRSLRSRSCTRPTSR